VEQRPAALRVLHAAQRSGLDLMVVNGRLKYDRGAAFDAGVLGELGAHETEIVAALEHRDAVLYLAAFFRVHAPRAFKPAPDRTRVIAELARRLYDVGTTRAAEICRNLERLQ
jgi:hypothetical protein